MATFSTTIAASSDDARQVGSSVTINGANINLSWSDHRAGFRFQNVTIPAGSIINSATVTLGVINTSSDTPNCTIYGEATDDAAAFTTSSNNISNRTLTTASVSWPASDIGAGSQDTPDLKTIIQEIIDRSGWVSGNDIAILLKGSTTSNFTFYTYDNGSGIPSITIEYTAGGGGPARERVEYLSGGIEVYP